MDLGFKLAVSNRNLKHPTSRQIFGDTSGLLCKNDQILRLNNTAVRYILLQYVYCCCLMLVWVSPSFCECDGRSDLRVAWQHDCSLHLSLSGRPRLPGYLLHFVSSRLIYFAKEYSLAEHQCDCSVSLQAFAVESFKHRAFLDAARHPPNTRRNRCPNGLTLCFTWFW